MGGSIDEQMRYAHLFLSMFDDVDVEDEDIGPWCCQCGMFIECECEDF